MDKALHIIKEIMSSTLTKDFNCAFPEIFPSLDVGSFQKQECDLDGVDFEYVKQSGCGDFGFHGEVAFDIGDGRYLLITYWE